MQFEPSLTFAQTLDQNDPLAPFRDRFYFPVMAGKPVVYFTGNSLGLQPKSTQELVLDELEDWATFGVEGHFLSRNPWYSYHEWFAGPLSRLVGAGEHEVVAMNQLTVNLHLLLVSFYRPEKKRFKIICEEKAFPSDQYALETQVRFHGFDPSEAIIEVGPRKGEYLIRHEDILSAIQKHKDELALVIFGGVNYFTGQLFDMQSITHAAHEAGAMAGFDLAHAAGNVKLELHRWDVDFACWCSYKYLNSGPGGVAGAFVHERFHKDTKISRFGGWWGHDKETRFRMEKGFRPMESAEAWQLSNAPVLSMAAHRAALELFDQAGMQRLLEKQRLMTAYLEFLIGDFNDAMKKKGKRDTWLEIITPRDNAQRGCQLSLIAHGIGKDLYNKLTAAGVITDWREPNVIRMAPVPLYNSFEDCFRFRKQLEKELL